MSRFSAAIAALIIAGTTAAYAQSANQRAEKEAISYLRPCHEPTSKRQIECEENQVDFVDTYIRAKSGDNTDMAYIANDFGPRDNKVDWIGLPEDHIQACAWRILSARDPHYEAIALRVCGVLSYRDHRTAYIRAGHLARELNTAPTTGPASNWYPHIPWIKPENAHPIDRSKLDGTARPFEAE